MKKKVKLHRTADRIRQGLARWNSVVLTAAAIVVAAGLRMALTPMFGTGYTFITFYPAIIFSTVLFGWKLGLAATLASALLSSILFLNPTVDSHHAWAIVVFLAANSLVILVGEAASRARKRAQAKATQALVREEGLRKEIAARMAAEEALRESEEKYRRFFNSLSHPVAIFEPVRNAHGEVVDWTCQDSNPSNLGIVGFDLKGLVGKRLSEILVGRERFARLLDGFRSVLETGEPWKHEVDFADRYYMASAFRVDDNVIAASSVDITERKRQEQRVAEQARLLDLTNDTIFVRNIEGCIIYWNKGAEESHGYTREEALGKSAHELLQTQFPEPLETIIQKLWRDNRWSGELVHTRRDGQRITVMSRWVLDRDPHGRPLSILETNNDITERKRAEEELARAKRQTEGILKSAGEAIFGLNTVGLCTFINPAGAEMFGYRVEEVLGKNTHRLLHHSHSDGREYPIQDCPIYAAFADGQMHRADDEVFWHKDGRPIPVSYTSTPIREAARLTGAVVVVGDITERKRAEEQLKQLTAELEQRVTARTSELIVMRDRLRAFAMQLNLTEQRERRRLANDLHDYLAQLLVVVRLKLLQAAPLIADDKAAHLLKEADEAITQALEYTHSLVAKLVPPSLHDFGLTEALEWLAAQMQRHGLAIVIKQDIETLALPEDQAVLMYQSIRELLFNVLKHASAKQATISVTVTPHETLEVTVADDGNGFDPAAIGMTAIGSKCFGLFSTRERMEVLGGRLELSSAVGQGTHATLIIPYRPLTEPAGSLGTPPPLRTEPSRLSTEGRASLSAPAPLRVLLVDDHAMVRQGLRSLLEGHDDVQVVGEAGDGALGIELAGALNPDVVVMDVTMPRIDGVEATRRIKQEHPVIAVVGLSVHGTTQVEAAMKAAGAAGFVSKESAGEELYEAIVAAGHMRCETSEVEEEA